VEQARNLNERNFESGLRFQTVADLAELNARARIWSLWFNATKNHTRHASRHRHVLTIARRNCASRRPPSCAASCSTHEPESRKVSDTLT
jgi:hypothetical protein